jgi:hypothetical protein
VQPDPRATRARLVVEPSSVAPDPDVPGSGVVAVFAVLPLPSPEGFVWGVDGVAERWSGSRWSPAGSFAVSLDFWTGAGRVLPPGESPFVPAIALGADDHGFGALGWLDLTGLEPGTYRLVQGRRADADPGWGPEWPMAGQVEILPPGGPGAAAPVPPPREAFLTTRAAVRAGAPRTVGVSVGLDPGLAWSVDTWDAQRRDHLGALAASARLDVREPATGAWTAVTDLPVRWTGELACLTFETDLPALDEGCYRVVLGASVAGELWAPFWAVS